MRLSFPAFSNLAALAPAPGVSYLLYDTFTDTDGTALTSHTMDVGSGWTATDSRQWTIKSNRVAADVGSTTPPQNATHANAGQGDVSISLSTQLGGVASGYYIGACARVTDGNNLWVIAYVTETATWSLIKRSSGTDTVVTYGPNFPIGTGIVYHTLTVLMRDDVFVVSVNGTVQCTWIDSTYKTNTKFGMVGDRLGIDTDGWRRDDFKVIAAPAQTTYVSDGFSGSGSISGRTPDTVSNGNWTLHSGTCTISGGVASQTSGTVIASVESTIADVLLTADLVAGGTDAYSGPSIRLTDSSNFWLIALDSVQDRLFIVEVSSGSYISRASVSFTHDGTTTYGIKTAASGNSISAGVYSSGTLQVSTAYHSASSNSTATKCGMRLATGATIDNFVVKSL